MAIFNNVYLIIDAADITTEMINWSTSKSLEEMPQKNGKALLECATVPPRAVFQGYVWYDEKSILLAWELI
jgi:hypothetical protein